MEREKNLTLAMVFIFIFWPLPPRPKRRLPEQKDAGSGQDRGGGGFRQPFRWMHNLRAGIQSAKDPIQSHAAEDRMAGSIEAKLARVGIPLPAPASPFANYVQF